MSTTVFEALQNAQYNFQTLGKHCRFSFDSNPLFLIALEQLDNAIKAIENGKRLDDVIQEDMFGEVNTGG